MSLVFISSLSYTEPNYITHGFLVPVSSTASPAKSQLILLTLLVLFSPLAIDIYLPAFPLMQASFHVEHAQVQDTISWFLFAMGLGQLFAGPLADKLGRRSVALLGISIYAVSSLLAWSAQSIEWMLIARLLQGLGACATSVAAFATVRDLFGPQKSGRMISYLNGAICFIPALAPILGSWLTQQFGWRSNFSFMAGFAITVLVMMIIWMKETNLQPSKEPVFKLNRYISILQSPIFLFHASLCMLAMAVILAYVTSAPVVLMSKLGLSMDEFTFWFAINAVINIIACMTAPKCMDTLGTRMTLMIGLIILMISGVMMLMLASIPSPIAFMLPIFLSSVGFAWILGTAAGKALAPFGDKAGTAAALLGLFQMSGSGLVIALVQRLGLEPQTLIAIQMLIVLPWLLVLFSSSGRAWHHVTA